MRPALSRSSSTKQKKRHATARLSFGPDDSAARDDASTPSEVITPKKTLGQRALPNNALRKSASFPNLHNLPTRFGSEKDRPRYSKEYLEELQSSTPNTPQKAVSSLDAEDVDDAMDLDPSELQGALIVQSSDLDRRSPSSQALTNTSAAAVANVLTETEIRERKERRARLAHQSDFLSLDASDEDAAEPRSNRITLDFKKKKTESAARWCATAHRPPPRALPQGPRSVPARQQSEKRRAEVRGGDGGSPQRAFDLGVRNRRRNATPGDLSVSSRLRIRAGEKYASVAKLSFHPALPSPQCGSPASSDTPTACPPQYSCQWDRGRPAYARRSACVLLWDSFSSSYQVFPTSVNDKSSSSEKSP
ncbi:nineteen complex-related protein 2-domain-containing protein [Cercophora newfieldiana]|uniref:Nineteen complex-related protein 2-domain-containing protein n=1 Tax=Cercophora newfieldiana TaxID=92897 RepID=A0AA40CXQ1_9PEZI|nr:nineteen complex-related protein 2-domain-containing protein [Cercophora newfieldiana]